MAPEAGSVSQDTWKEHALSQLSVGGHGVTHCLETLCKSLCGHPAVAQYSQLANKMPFLLVVMSTATVA